MTPEEAEKEIKRLIGDDFPYPAQWTGWPQDSIPPARAILSAHNLHDTTPEEIRESAEFCDGKQWDDRHIQERIKHGRPTLTVNVISGILASAIAQESNPLSAGDIDALKFVLYRELGDAQRLYNYTNSALAELVGVKLRDALSITGPVK